MIISELSSIVYEDYDVIGKSVIGRLKNYVRTDELDAAFMKHGISPTVKTYEDYKALDHALVTGEIDIAAVSSHSVSENYTVVDKFSFAPYFFVSWKGNDQLTDQIPCLLLFGNP